MMRRNRSTSRSPTACPARQDWPFATEPAVAWYTAIIATAPAAELADVNSLFNICQRIAGALGIGLIAAAFTAWARVHGPIPALHDTGLLLTAIAALATAAATLLSSPPRQNQQ